jgi:hypothetical protein
MKRIRVLRHEFVEFIPSTREDGVIYVSMTYATVVHNCCCGCGSKVVTPLSPTDWKLTFDGKTVSLFPSIGNWSLSCRSHYWIKNNRVHWAEQWSQERIQAARADDERAKQLYFDTGQILQGAEEGAKGTAPRTTIWQRLRAWWSGRDGSR